MVLPDSHDLLQPRHALGKIFNLNSIETLVDGIDLESEIALCAINAHHQTILCCFQLTAHSSDLLFHPPSKIFLQTMLHSTHMIEKDCRRDAGVGMLLLHGRSS